MLMSQGFVEWYDTHFMDHVYGEAQGRDKDVILNNISQLIEFGYIPTGEH